MGAPGEAGVGTVGLQQVAVVGAFGSRKVNTLKISFSCSSVVPLVQAGEADPNVAKYLNR